jgi:hypothetical protein
MGNAKCTADDRTEQDIEQWMIPSNSTTGTMLQRIRTTQTTTIRNADDVQAMQATHKSHARRRTHWAAPYVTHRTMRRQGTQATDASHAHGACRYAQGTSTTWG